MLEIWLAEPITPTPTPATCEQLYGAKVQKPMGSYRATPDNAKRARHRQCDPLVLAVRRAQLDERDTCMRRDAVAHGLADGALARGGVGRQAKRAEKAASQHAQHGACLAQQPRVVLLRRA